MVTISRFEALPPIGLRAIRLNYRPSQFAHYHPSQFALHAGLDLAQHRRLAFCGCAAKQLDQKRHSQNA